MWFWLKCAGAGLLLVAFFYGLHRFALYLERAGYIYYTKDRFAAGVGRSMLAMQEELEPAARHVIEVKDDAHLRELESAAWNKWLAQLLAALGRFPSDPDELQRIREESARDGLDWERLSDAARERGAVDRRQSPKM